MTFATFWHPRSNDCDSNTPCCHQCLFRVRFDTSMLGQVDGERSIPERILDRWGSDSLHRELAEPFFTMDAFAFSCAGLTAFFGRLCCSIRDYAARLSNLGSMAMPASVSAMTAPVAMSTAPVTEAERHRRSPPAIPRVRGIVRRVVGGRDVHGRRRDIRGSTLRCGRDVLGVGAVREAAALRRDFVLGSDSRNGGIVAVWIVAGADVVAAGQRKQCKGATFLAEAAEKRLYSASRALDYQRRKLVSYSLELARLSGFGKNEESGD